MNEALPKKERIYAYKRYGQHFLKDKRIRDRIIENASLSESDTVLEIGCGTGFLTEKLVEKSRVIGIEKDKRLASILKNRFQNNQNFILVCDDALKIEFPPFTRIVSNLPYQISAPITFKILKYEFEKGVLMYQKEFAEKMVAKPKTSNYSRLSLNLSVLADVRILEFVSKDAFYPRPKVDSAVVEILPKKPGIDCNLKLFFEVSKAAFGTRRKKIKNSIISNLDSSYLQGIDKEKIPFGDRRPEELSREDFAEITNFLENQ